MILSKEQLRKDKVMKGFILNIRKAKNEDITVTVLSNLNVERYWRFFGARHSILQLGNLIDFEVQESKNGFMKQLRGVTHISFPWIFSSNRLSIWQDFIKLFEPHLKDTTYIEPFYFDLLLKVALRWHKQNPKRLAIEAYLEILEHEGRLHDNGFCYICEDILDEEIGLMRAYIPAHTKCVYGFRYKKRDIFKLFDTKSTIHLDDKIVDTLFDILLKGL